MKYDALLLLSFGGPEKPDEVMPFLENVLRGRNVPPERMEEVSKHYYEFGGKSPINDQNRALIDALSTELASHEIDLPIYWGNRNWHPLLTDTMENMVQDGVKRALVFVTSIFSSYSGCRQYREDILKSQAEIGEHAPELLKIRSFYNHPGFIETMRSSVRDAVAEIPAERHATTQLIFTAHSIPNAMADTCDYVQQLNESCSLVASDFPDLNWQLVYQSRSGPPSQPWLEPDVCDTIEQLGKAKQVTDVVVIPIGFISDHMEVLFDLDTEAKQVATDVGINLVRAATASIHPQFISMIRELIQERLSENPERPSLGQFGPSHDTCPEGCCAYSPGRPGTHRPTAS
ncbi:MAG: ferrochelatase [Blastopirellula sp.]|nr:MAG: ferrochelatase [Blastopirellula sp.]